MREIGVHLHDDFVMIIKCPAESFLISLAQSFFPLPMQNFYLGIFFSYLFGELAGAVRGIIIDNQNIEIQLLLRYFCNKSRYVVFLVVSRNQNNFFSVLS